MRINSVVEFYLVGVGRSGTSLLQSILSSHSEFCMPPETGFVRSNILNLKKRSGFTLDSAKEIAPKLDRVLSSINNEVPHVFKNELEFYNFILKEYKANQNKKFIGDKDPRLVEFINSVSSLLPGTKFIHLIRDPRDVLLSKKKAEWSQGRPSWYHVFANYIQLKLGEYQGRQLSKDAYHLVSYEELLDNSEQALTDLCNFLGFEFEPSMLKFQDKAKELVSDEEKQWKKETMGPLLKNNTGKWKGKLNDWEVALTERLCTQAFELGGYEYSNVFKQLSSIQKLKVIALQWGLRTLGFIYIPYRILSQKLLVAWKY